MECKIFGKPAVKTTRHCSVRLHIKWIVHSVSVKVERNVFSEPVLAATPTEVSRTRNK